MSIFNNPMDRGFLMGGLVGDILSGLGYADGGKMVAGTANAAADSVSTATQNDINAINSTLGTTNTDVNNAVSGAANTLNNFLGATNANVNPYLQSGVQGNTDLQNYVSQNGGTGPQFNPMSVSQYMNSPAEQFQLQQGQQAIGNSAAAQGLASSGAAAKELTQYGQGLASTYYQQAFNDAQNTFQTNQNATMQNLGMLLNSGEYGTSQYNSTMINAGNQEANNPINANEFLGGLNLTGQETAGAAGIYGAQTAGNLDLEGQEAAVGGNLGETNAFNNGLSSLASLALLA